MMPCTITLPLPEAQLRVHISQRELFSNFEVSKPLDSFLGKVLALQVE